MDFNRIRVSRKIWGAIVLLLAAMLVITWFTLWRAVATQQAASQAVRGQYATIVRIAEWKALVSASVTRTVAAASSADREVEKILKADQERAAAQLGLLYAQVQQAAVRADDKAQLQKIDGLYKVLEAKTKDVREAQEDGDGSVVQGRVHGHMLPAAKAYLGAIDDYVLMQQAHADETRAQAVSASRSIAVIGTVGAVLVVALGMFVASTLVRTIRQPLRESVALAEAIAQGDLTQRMDATRGDEFGELMRSLQNMNAFLERMVGNVRESVENIAGAAGEIAQGNQNLSARTEQTASNLQQTAASMHHITDTVHKNADAARQATALAASASQAAQRGGQVVGQVVSTMEAITQASRRIADIIGVIDGIAFQTNILALNAAVEAARAGEQGRGFAVVATEVRSLAQRSAEAAKEIKGLIGASSEKVESGAQLVQAAGSTMGEIVGAVKRVTDIMDAIMAATTEQSEGIGQVNQAVGQLDTMTQQNAALVEESASAAISLREQAAQMGRLMEAFRVTQAPAARFAAIRR